MQTIFSLCSVCVMGTVPSKFSYLFSDDTLVFENEIVFELEKLCGLRSRLSCSIKKRFFSLLWNEYK